MSTVCAVVRSRAARQRSIVSRSMFSATRSGPASTWQWRQVMLQRRPTLIWKISSGAGLSSAQPHAPRAASKSPPRQRERRRGAGAGPRCDASGEPRARRLRVPLGPAARVARSGSAAPASGWCHSGHSRVPRVLEHLDAVDQRGASPDGRGHVDRLRHLLEIGALLEARLRVRVDAVGALDGVGHAERDQRLLALAEGALGEDRVVPGEELLGEVRVPLGDGSELPEVLGRVVAAHRDLLLRCARCGSPPRYSDCPARLS